MPGKGVGRVARYDLTVPDAEQVKHFYAEIAGWRPEALDMGGYATASSRIRQTPMLRCTREQWPTDGPSQYATVIPMVSRLLALMSIGLHQGGELLDREGECDHLSQRWATRAKV